MTLAPRQAERLLKIIELAMSILDESRTVSPGSRKNEISNPNLASEGKRGRASKSKASRRSGAELVAFRNTLISERAQGIPVAEIARKHGISTAYIYQLRPASGGRVAASKGKKASRAR